MYHRVGAERLWTVPNVLSGFRLLLLSVFAIGLFTLNNRYLAFGCLAAAGVTDYLDGYIARRFDQVTDFGKLLDPIVDRVLLSAAVISLIVYGAIPLWLGVVVLVREGAILVGGVVVGLHGQRDVEVLPIGKAGAFGLMCVLPLFLIADASGPFATICRVVAWVGVIPSLALCFAASVAYARLACETLNENAPSQSAPPAGAVVGPDKSR